MKAQRGYVALAMMMALLIGFFFAATKVLNRTETSLASGTGPRAQPKLEIIKQALILDAAGLHDSDSTPGQFAPQMDMSDDSLSKYFAGADSDEPRRLHYARLGIAPPNLSEECVWLAVSPAFRSGLSNSARTTADLKINPGNFGSIKIQEAVGDTNPETVIAVLIAPGPPLPHQDRLGAGQNGCRNGPLEHFIETWDAANRRFIRSGANGKPTNDRIVTINRDELFPPILRRVLQSFGPGANVPGRLRWFLTGNGKNLADLVDQSQPASADKPASRLRRDTSITCSTQSGAPPCFDQQFAASNVDLRQNNPQSNCPALAFVSPDGSTHYSYTNPASWLCYNDWYSYLEYRVDSKGTVNTDDDTATLSPRNTPQAFGCTLQINERDSTDADTLKCDDIP